MKKLLLGLTMGAMLIPLGQATTAEASISSKAPTCQVQTTYSGAAHAKLSTKYKKQDIAKPVTQSPATPVATKPVAQKPATNTQPVAQKPTEASATQQSDSISSIEQQVLTLTNQERAKAGLKPLATDSKLMNAAREKSTDMRTNNYFSHTSPTFGSPFDRMKALGITYKAAAENIAMGQKTADEVVKGWMNSPGHRANIMNGNFTHIGIGYDAQGHYWTQQFIQK